MLDFNWKSTVKDVMDEHIYDKVTITSWDDVQLYDGDAFGVIDGMLLSRPVAELVDGFDKTGYDCAHIKLCQCEWQIKNLPSYDELQKKVWQLENELVMVRNEAKRQEEWADEAHREFCHEVENERTALGVMRLAMKKKMLGKKVKLKDVAADVAIALGFPGFFDE